MNKIKINDFVTAFSNILGLNDNTKDVLIELMQNIIVKYEKVIDYIPTSSDNSAVYLIKSVDNKYSVEDFFLNRLMRNVWSYSEISEKDIKEGFADIHLKGNYDPHYNEVNINIVKVLNQIDKYKQYLESNYQSMKLAAQKKVVMHEFEHALQTKFDNQLNFGNREIYKKISLEINKIGKYDINSYDSFPKNLSDKSNYLSTGIHYSSFSDSLGIKTYRNIDGFDNLNEILNESESLEMAKQNHFLNRVYQDGNYYPLLNPESSNSSITNYGFIIKVLLGERKSFEGMYLNPQAIFETFNTKYNSIFQKSYNSNKDAIEILIEQLDLIKQYGKEEDILLLNETFAKCLKVDIINDINNNIPKELLKNKIESFSKYTVKNGDLKKNNELKNIIIINELQDIITNKKNQNNIINDKNTLINSINKDLLKRQIKLNEYSNITFKQYLEEIFYDFIPNSNMVELKNGLSITTKQYIEEIVLSNANKYGINVKELIENTLSNKQPENNYNQKGKEKMEKEQNKNYEFYLNNIKNIIIERRNIKRNSHDLSDKEKENKIFLIHQNIDGLNKSLASLEDILKVYNFVIDNFNNDGFENKIANDILSSLPIKKNKHSETKTMNNNNVTELDNQINNFISKCKTIEINCKEFETKKLKDTKLLESLIDNIYSVKEEGIEILKNNITEEQYNQINRNIMLLQELEETMKKYKSSLDDLLNDFSRKI